jgi:hypothetical protein
MKDILHRNGHLIVKIIYLQFLLTSYYIGIVRHKCFQKFRVIHK